jgi:hypothetical protein
LQLLAFPSFLKSEVGLTFGLCAATGILKEEKRMTRRSLSLVTLLLVLSALPLSASQFIEMPFDKVAREATLVVQGTIGQTFSGWDDAHEVIYTYATVHVSRYFGETTGPDTLMIREVGGTVDGYTMEAIGFPVIRSGHVDGCRGPGAAGREEHVRRCRISNGDHEDRGDGESENGLLFHVRSVSSLTGADPCPGLRAKNDLY